MMIRFREYDTDLPPVTILNATNTLGLFVAETKSGGDWRVVLRCGVDMECTHQIIVAGFEIDSREEAERLEYMLWHTLSGAGMGREHDPDRLDGMVRFGNDWHLSWVNLVCAAAVWNQRRATALEGAP